MSSFSPFSASRSMASVGGLTFVSQHGRIAVSGDLQLTKDRVGLSCAEALHAMCSAILGVYPAALASSGEDPAPVVLPFAEDASSVGIGALTVENGTDRVSLYGSDTLSQDAAGLDTVRQMRSLATATLCALKSVDALPDKVAVTNSVDTVVNPFG